MNKHLHTYVYSMYVQNLCFVFEFNFAKKKTKQTQKRALKGGVGQRANGKGREMAAGYVYFFYVFVFFAFSFLFHFLFTRFVSFFCYFLAIKNKVWVRFLMWSHVITKNRVLVDENSESVRRGGLAGCLPVCCLPSAIVGCALVWFELMMLMLCMCMCTCMC